MVYCSGSVDMNPSTNTLIEGEVGDRAEQRLINMESFALVNMVYEKYFHEEPKPVQFHTISQDSLLWNMC
ncbi:hypothetical protein GGI42DRAFT_327283 [Trichoderma sp. SZMC 28013]